jgi:hypothetical protein
MNYCQLSKHQIDKKYSMVLLSYIYKNENFLKYNFKMNLNLMEKFSFNVLMI